MAVTVDYGPCEKCGEKNSTSATKCRTCGATLPWVKPPKQSKLPQMLNKGNSSTATSSGSTLPTGFAPEPKKKSIPRSRIDLSTYNGAGLQIVGAIVFVGGIAVRIAGVFHIIPYIPFAGYGAGRCPLVRRQRLGNVSADLL